MHDRGSLMVNDARSVATGFAGSVAFGDAVSYHLGDSISLNYRLAVLGIPRRAGREEPVAPRAAISHRLPGSTP